MIMVRKFGDLAVTENQANLDIENGRVRIRLYMRDGGYVQEFHAIDRTGQYRPVLSSLHKNLIAASDHRAAASPMIAGERPHLFGVSRESLRMVYSEAQITEHTAQAATVRLSGTVQGHALICNIRIQGNSNYIHVSVDDTIASEDDDPLVEYVMSAYAFLPGETAVTNGRPLDYTWAPILRPKKDNVIADCAFGSPAVIVQQESAAAALIPDLHVLDNHRPMPTALDLDLANGLLFAPLLSYGFCGYGPTSNGSFFRHDVTMSRRLNPPSLSYAFDLFISADTRRRSIHSTVSRYMWTTYGSLATRQPLRPYQLATRPSTQLPRVSADTHTGLTPKTAREILEPAMQCLALYESTGTEKHLKEGLKALDQACLLQSVWRLSWNEDFQPGMCASSNVGWQPDVIFTAEFARCAMRFGAITGDRYYFERGTAALMAALNAQGLDSDSQSKLNECADAIRSDYGSAYVHVSKKWGASTPDARIRRLEFGRNLVSLDFAPHPSPNGHRRVVFGGLKANTYTVRINNHRLTATQAQLQSGLLLPE